MAVGVAAEWQWWQQKPFFGQKPHYFTYFSSKHEQFSFIYYVKIMLI